MRRIVDVVPGEINIGGNSVLMTNRPPGPVVDGNVRIPLRIVKMFGYLQQTISQASHKASRFGIKKGYVVIEYLYPEVVWYDGSSTCP